ncbi:hypothetical protein L6452_02453 [Arctium lappa]|uniref:Uncharacterized protein n=1 Tax=Arctium lappa TaxID=4217 RepID=A0ACB9FJN4_ARCLA|nr:hypothetical protein L6452_02453 [Arctium lappa]
METRLAYLETKKFDPLPPIFKQMIKRMVRWHVLPPTCAPSSCIVNIYEEGDRIPPHIDHHDFFRPFCTISFLTECNILFGSHLKIVSPREFPGPPLVLTPSRKPPLQQSQNVMKEPSPHAASPPPRATLKLSGGSSFVIGENDFPPLGVGNPSQQRGHKRNGLKS